MDWPNSCDYDGGDCCLGGDMAECPLNGVITSPGYPRNYNNNIDMTWLIQVPEGLSIEIRFEVFELELASGIDQSCRYIPQYYRQ